MGKRRWGMVVDLDRCTGCQTCVVACQAENNVPLNTVDIVDERRAITWIRIERYWDGLEAHDPAKVKARPGFADVPAVRAGALHEIKSSIILQPGPAALTDGLAALQKIIHSWCEQRDSN